MNKCLYSFIKISIIQYKYKYITSLTDGAQWEDWHLSCRSQTRTTHSYKACVTNNRPLT